MSQQTQLTEAAAALFRDMQWRESLGLVAPEIVLAATIVAVVVYDMFFKREESFKSGVLALAGVGAAWVFSLKAPAAGVGFAGAYLGDSFAHFFRSLFLLATFVAVLTSLLSAEINRYRQGEYYAVLLTATLSICLLAAAGNVVIFFLALETLSL